MQFIADLERNDDGGLQIGAAELRRGLATPGGHRRTKT
jgi:hypothetical protein